MTLTKKNKSILILSGIVIALMIGIFQSKMTTRKKNHNIKLFYESNVFGEIDRIQKCSGGFVNIQLKNGEEFTFCPSGEFGKLTDKGDSISKPAFFFEIFIHKKDTLYSYSFITPTVSQMR